MLRRLLLILVTALLVLVASCSTQDSVLSVGQDGDTATSTIPELDVIAIEQTAQPIRSVKHLTQETDAIVSVQLVGIEDRTRVVFDDEGGLATEFVGLQFEIVETFSGEIDGKDFVADLVGYYLDAVTGERRSRVQVGDLDVSSEESFGETFLVAVVFDETIGYRIYGADYLVSVSKDGRLGSAEAGGALHSLGVDSLDQLRSEAASN